MPVVSGGRDQRGGLAVDRVESSDPLPGVVMPVLRNTPPTEVELALVSEITALPVSKSVSSWELGLLVDIRCFTSLCFYQRQKLSVPMNDWDSNTVVWCLSQLRNVSRIRALSTVVPFVVSDIVVEFNITNAYRNQTHTYRSLFEASYNLIVDSTPYRDYIARYCGAAVILDTDYYCLCEEIPS